MSNEVRTTEAPDLKGYLMKHISVINDVAASTLTPDRMVRLVCAAVSKDAQLAKCSPMSILRSVAQAASMGLEPFDGRNEVHLVPRWNKHAKCLEATCLVGYPGLIRLATDTGKTNYLDAQVVYAKDDFDYGLGDEPFVKHRPYLGKDRGERIAVYAVAKLATGERKIELIPYHEIQEIRDRSVDSDKFSPWKTDESEMARKTGIRRLAKYLPKSKALAAALEHQARTEAGRHFDEVMPTGFRPGDAPVVDERQTEQNGDGQEVFIWTETDIANFHTACDVMDSMGATEDQIAHYKSQKDAGEDPQKVLNRMGNWKPGKEKE